MVLGPLAEDGGDVLGRVALRRAHELAFAAARALGELLVHRAEVADLRGVLIHPGHRVAIGAQVGDPLLDVGG